MNGSGLGSGHGLSPEPLARALPYPALSTLLSERSLSLPNSPVCPAKGALMEVRCSSPPSLPWRFLLAHFPSPATHVRPAAWRFIVTRCELCITAFNVLKYKCLFFLTVFGEILTCCPGVSSGPFPAHVGSWSLHRLWVLGMWSAVCQVLGPHCGSLTPTPSSPATILQGREGRGLSPPACAER